MAATIPSPSRSSRAPLALRRRSGSASCAADPAAFAALYDEHHQAIYRYCRSILRQEEDARDAVQTTFANAYAALQQDGRRPQLRAWLFRIAHNESITLIRRRRSTEDLDAAAAVGSDSLSREVDTRQELRLLQADLADLAERHRAALLLRELSGLAHDEIAAVLSTTPRAVKQVIFEARSALHDCREGRAMPCDDVRRALSDGDGRLLRGRRYRAHLRDCGGCRAFQAALDERPARLAAMCPLLPAAASGAILNQIAPAAEAASSMAASGAAGSTAAASGSTAATTASTAATAGSTAATTAVTAATTTAATAATAATTTATAGGIAVSGVAGSGGLGAFFAGKAAIVAAVAVAAGVTGATAVVATGGDDGRSGAPVTERRPASDGVPTAPTVRETREGTASRPGTETSIGATGRDQRSAGRGDAGGSDHARRRGDGRDAAAPSKRASAGPDVAARRRGIDGAGGRPGAPDAREQRPTSPGRVRDRSIAPARAPREATTPVASPPERPAAAPAPSSPPVAPAPSAGVSSPAQTPSADAVPTAPDVPSTTGPRDAGTDRASHP